MAEKAFKVNDAEATNLTVTNDVSVTNNVTVDGTITSTSFINNGVGTPEISSASTLNVTAPDGIFLNSIIQSTEKLATKTGATGTVPHDLDESGTWYHTGMVANFEPNITNVPLTDNIVTNVVLILSQGATAYIPTTFRINDNLVTPVYLGGITPVGGTANGLDIFSLSIIRVGGVYTLIVNVADYF